MRMLWAVILNLPAPGTGLIVLGRIWVGLSLTAWFVCTTELAFVGQWVAPASIPRFLTLTGAGTAAFTWVLGQVLLIARVRYLRDPELPRELAILRRLASRALRQGDLKTARAALLVARSVDDDDLVTTVLWARLVSQRSGPRRARKVWRRVALMDAQREYADETAGALPPGRSA